MRIVRGNLRAQAIDNQCILGTDEVLRQIVRSCQCS
jgi:hypothetical protein